MNYLKLMIVSLVLLTANLSAAESTQNHVAVAEKGAAMKNLKQKFAHDHKLQGHEANHTKQTNQLHKPTTQPKK